MLNWSKDTLSIVQVVASVARKAGTSAIESVALVRNWHADLVGVEDPVGRALQAKLFVPVPGGASNIRNSLSGSEDALSIVEVISSVAGETSTVAVEGVALVRHRHANFVCIEDPVVRALQANLLVPVP